MQVFLQKKLRRLMSLSNFSKSVFILGITRFVEFVVGLVRVKLNALYLGVAGVGLVDQLIFFAQQTSTFTLLSMGEGLVKQLAQITNSEHKSNIICSSLKSYICLITLFMVLSISVLILLNNYFIVWVFGNGDFFFFFIVALLCVPILILNSIPFSLLKAFKGTIYIAKARMVIVVVNLSILIPLLLFYALKGAVVYVFLSYVTTLIINFIFAKRAYFYKYDISLRKILKTPLNQSNISELLVFSVFGVTVGLFLIISEMAIRSIIVTRMGVEGIGLYSPVIMWASMFTGIVLPTFSTYLYPRFCSAQTTKEISQLINDGLRLASFSILPFLLIGIPFRDFFVALFYSEAFIHAASFVPIHFFGLVFYAWWYVLSQSLTPTGRIKQHGVFLTLMYVINILIVYFLIDDFGLLSYAIKFSLPPVIFFFVYVFYCKNSMNVTISSKNILLMSYVLVSGGGVLLLSLNDNYLYISFLLGPFLLPFVYFILTKSEKELINIWLNQILQFFKFRTIDD